MMSGASACEHLRNCRTERLILRLVPNWNRSRSHRRSMLSDPSIRSALGRLCHKFVTPVFLASIPNTISIQILNVPSFLP